MSDIADGKSSNGAAIGVATVVAGVVGTLASSLFSGKASRKEQAQKRVEERLQTLEAHTSQAVDQLVKAVDGFEFHIPGDSRRAKRKARELGKATRRVTERAASAARRQAADLEREASRLHALEKANQLGHDASKRARELAVVLNARASELMSGNRMNLPEWKTRTSRSTSDAIGKGSDLFHRAIDSAPDVKERVSASSSGAASRASGAAHDALDRAPDVVDRLSRSLGDVAQHGAKVAGKVRDEAPGVLDKASKSAHEAVDQAQRRAPEVRDLAHDVAVEASHRAHQVAHQAKVHAPEIGAQVATALHSVQEAAKPALDDVSAMANRLKDSAKEAGTHASETLVPEVHHRVDAVAGKAKTHGQASATSLAALGTAAGDKLSHTSDVIEHQSKAVASAAGHGTKEAGLFVMWTAAAAGIIYYAFLDEEKRAKARASGQRIAAEIKDVYRDIRGYDEEFT